VALGAMRVMNNAPIRGRYTLRGNVLTIIGTRSVPGRKTGMQKVTLELQVDLEQCTLHYEGQRLFGDEPDTCNT